MKITACTAKEILDSRGVPTIEVEMFSGDTLVQASVPSGKSTGSREAVELRDPDGRGVSNAISNVNDIISKEIIGVEMDPYDIDRKMLELDGTDNKSNLGANAMLCVSIAATKLAAALEKVPVWKFIASTSNADAKLPKLFMNVINGGAHSDFRLPFQEYIIVPKDELVSSSYDKAKSILKVLGRKVKEKFGDVPIGDEGGYSPAFEKVEDPFELLDSIIYSDTFLAIDAAATELCKTSDTETGCKTYSLLGKDYSTNDLLELYGDISRKFNIRSIEDPFEESDVLSFSKLTKNIGDNALIVGDDLTVTNPSLITEMSNKKSVNAVIIKPNQVGTLLEVYEAVALARGAGWKIIASHRSGETMDSFIADLAVGIGAYGIKAGSPLRKERKVKYDRLLRIEKEMLNQDL